jgi:diguanylate cyclase (GGDEF)-like protein
MSKIWEFYENMNEIVYVCDVETYELVYMNRKTRELYNVRSVEELKGKKCYELFQMSLAPCGFCNNERLAVGHFEEWEYFNPVLGKPFILKDTLIEEDGRYYRMELAIEQTSQDMQKKSIREYINNESIINEGLRISLSTVMPDESFARLLEYIGKALRCDRIYIFEEKQESYFCNTYEWCAEGVTPEIDNLQHIPREDASVWLEQFQSKKNVIIPNIEDIKTSDPVMYEYLLPQNIHSLVVSPLKFNHKVIGFYGVDNPPEELLNSISTLFLILGSFIVSLIRRRDLFKQLENMSFYDQLTGIGNRHAMEAFVLNMQPENSIGIVYCDVMGLKKINDIEGHQAGDALLIRACGALQRTFPQYSLFRIGGDEFVVLCAGIEEKELEEREVLLKQDMKEHSAMMAVGCVWREKSVEDIDHLLLEADEAMYRDKRQYYAENSKIKPRITNYCFQSDEKE